jgi:hypothetical protein
MIQKNIYWLRIRILASHKQVGHCVVSLVLYFRAKMFETWGFCTSFLGLATNKPTPKIQIKEFSLHSSHFALLEENGARYCPSRNFFRMHCRHQVLHPNCIFYFKPATAHIINLTHEGNRLMPYNKG